MWSWLVSDRGSSTITSTAGLVSASISQLSASPPACTIDPCQASCHETPATLRNAHCKLSCWRCFRALRSCQAKIGPCQLSQPRSRLRFGEKMRAGEDCTGWLAHGSSSARR